MVHQPSESESTLEAVHPDPQDPRAAIEAQIESGVWRLLAHHGQAHSGTTDTGRRFTKWLREATAGYEDDPKAILSKTFEAPYDEMIVLSGIRFVSTCEHHLLPFSGWAAVGYVPLRCDGNEVHLFKMDRLYRVVGVSKLARLVECFARRFQIQERMTQQIANALSEHLKPKGIGVLVKAHHSCMGCRGVKQQESNMVTSVMLGALRDKVEARTEFLRLANVGT
jgi:GTP cyclohydrolase I